MFILNLKNWECRLKKKMNGIWSNYPEVWANLNKQYEISDMGNVRDKESETVLHRIKYGKGYAGVSMYGTWRKVHPWVLQKFVPCPALVPCSICVIISTATGWILD
jgi:hypothetical protein